MFVEELFMKRVFLVSLFSILSIHSFAEGNTAKEVVAVRGGYCIPQACGGDLVTITNTSRQEQSQMADAHLVDEALESVNLITNGNYTHHEIFFNRCPIEESGPDGDTAIKVYVNAGIDAEDQGDNGCLEVTQIDPITNHIDEECLNLNPSTAPYEEYKDSYEKCGKNPDGSNKNSAVTELEAEAETDDESNSCKSQSWIQKIKWPTWTYPGIKQSLEKFYNSCN